MDNVIKFDYENHNPELVLNEFETGITPEDALKKSHNGMAIRKENETIKWKDDADIYDPAKLINLGFVEGNEIEIIVEEAKKLHLITTPEIANIPNVCWESSNPIIATINQEGVVYGRANGTVTITATDINDSNNYVSIEVTVTGEQAKIYSFTTYDATGETEYGYGRAITTGKTIEVDGASLTEIEILSNSADESFVGQKFYIDSNAKADGITLYPLLDAEGTESGITVTITKL